MQNSESCTFVITEKPDAAYRIAQALDASHKPRRITENGVPYFEANRHGRIVIVPALGHLYTVTGDTSVLKGGPIFNVKWVPRYSVEHGASQTRTWLRVITKLARDADNFVDACDYDLEGSIIGFCILKYACGDKDQQAKRMKYSTLTKDELEDAYEHLLPKLDFPLIEAGLLRHEVDWLYGINLSRALTSAAKKAGEYAVLSTGRVQGPSLRFLALLEKKIQTFASTPFWNVKATLKVDSIVLDVLHDKKAIKSKAEAEAIVDSCRDRSGTVENVETETFKVLPPFPFDLGSLQAEAYRLFGYTPIRTSSIAQHLYLNALISYPRTSSQRLPPSINYETILKSLNGISEYANHVRQLLTKANLKPVEGKGFDPAHPAIYPTGLLPEKKLVGAEKNIWNLIVRRFLTAFDDSATQKTVKITFSVNGERFLFDGMETLEEGWLSNYDFSNRHREMHIPSLKEGQKIQIEKVMLKEEYTKPPQRYNPSTLLRKMEASEIGTKATRASIIETLYNRDYVRQNNMEVTPLGLAVTDVLNEFCPSMVSVDLTRQLEKRMILVQEGRETKDEVLREVVEFLKPVLSTLIEHKGAVGVRLSQAIKQANTERSVIGGCPTCKTGKLSIIYSKKTGKRFAGCSNYFRSICRTSFPLPQSGLVKPSGKPCRNCGWPTVNVWLKMKRPWILCLNPECPSKKRSKGD